MAKQAAKSSIARQVISLIIPLIMIAEGMYVICFLAYSITFHCNRASNGTGSCILEQSWLAGKKSNRINLLEIKGAQTRTTAKGFHNTYLITKTEEICLSPHIDNFINPDTITSTTNKINAFITNKAEKDLTIKQSDTGIWYLSGGIILLIGLIFTFITTKDILNSH